MKITGQRFYGTYETARAIAGFLSAIGWVLVAIGALIALSGLNAAAPFNAVIAGIGLGVAATGLLQVAAGQMLRATVDSADYSRQGLAIQVALVEGRDQVDLQHPFKNQSEDASLTRLADAEQSNGQVRSDIAAGLSKEAVAALRKAVDRGYEARFSADKTFIILKSGSWEQSFSSQDEIIKFAQAMR